MPVGQNQALKSQNPSQPHGFVFTLCKIHLAEQIPPETADLCKLQGHVKKLQSGRATEEGCLFLKPVPPFKSESNVHRGVYSLPSEDFRNGRAEL